MFKCGDLKEVTMFKLSDRKKVIMFKCGDCGETFTKLKIQRESRGEYRGMRLGDAQYSLCADEQGVHRQGAGRIPGELCPAGGGQLSAICLVLGR